MSAEDSASAARPWSREAEALVAVADPAEAEAALSRGCASAWAELQADTDVDAALTQRFEAAIEAVREAAAVRAAERAAEQERRSSASASRPIACAVCEAIEELDGADAVDRFAELKVQWDGLPPISADYSAALTRRFQDACRRFEERERRRGLAEVAAGAARDAGRRARAAGGLRAAAAQELMTRWRDGCAATPTCCARWPTPTRRRPSAWSGPSPCSRRRSTSTSRSRPSRSRTT